MIGIIVQLAISWLLLWFIEKTDLRVFGLNPRKQRVLDFATFFFITAICCTAGFILRMIYGERWGLNPHVSFTLIAEGVWWNIKSVLFEELIFRGALFYILIKRIGPVKAIIISAFAFGIYHWFSFGIFGNVSQMIPVFIITGLMGVVLAYGYSKTFSLYLPIAIHSGWNMTSSVIFSDTNIGNHLLMKLPAKVVQVSYFTYYLVTLGPIVGALLINFYLIKRKKQAAAP
jgi:membrane protease YdiL (CAAX protease family)